MQITVDGRGDYTLSLVEGSLLVEHNGVVVLSTLGNPTKEGDVPFSNIEEAHQYFTTLPISQPVEVITEEEGA